MPIRLFCIKSDLAAVAAITATPGNGATRPTFSPEWRRARDYVIKEAAKIGCTHRISAAGNVHIRPPHLTANNRPILCGSHIDSVPNGGDFDGVIGCLVPLELLRAAAEDKTPIDLELVIFAEEEGPTFGLGMLGSRAWVGELSAAELRKLKNKAGEDFFTAGKPHGVDEAKLKSDRLRPTAYAGLIEVHIEQGPGMWRRNQPVAVVTAIAGRYQYRCTVTGEANHAGSTSMVDRQDALAAAAEIVVALEKIPSAERSEVLTVGRMTINPNAINVVPGCVEFTIDGRAPSDSQLKKIDAAIRKVIVVVVQRRGIRIDLLQTESQPAAPMNRGLVKALDDAVVAETRKPVVHAVSGALHDSAILAPHLPTVMLFVASKDGISHNPAEFSRVGDIALAAKIVYSAVRKMSR